MINNDVLRSLRHALNVTDAKLVEITELGGVSVTAEQISTYLKKEEEPGFALCPDDIMACFLNGLVLHKRGPNPDRPPQPIEVPLTNNIILKKVRVAFELKDLDLAELIKKTGLTVSKTELGAFFRSPSHRNYRPCGDQFLRNLLKGLNT